METQRTRDRLTGEHLEEDYEMPGLGRWAKRNVWLLVRLFMVIVFTFGTSLIVDRFSYGLEVNPADITAEEINEGNLPAGVEEGDYVRITGAADVGENLTPQNVGTEESGIGVSARYSVPYYYFRLRETNDNLLVQTGNGLPNFYDIEGEQVVWEGSLSTVGTVIFFSTTQEGLERAGLPRDRSIPVVEVGETPETYRDLFPAYSVVIAVWLASLVWLLWRRNTPFG
ncbi:MAG: hypothetical protein ACRDSJ_18290 [Rubrobacteraceae bacterium]